MDQTRDRITVEKLPSGRWRGRAWDPKKAPTKLGGKPGGYRNVISDSREGAMEAAEKELSRLTLGLTKAGKCELSSIWAAYRAERMEGGKAKTRTISSMQDVVDRLTAAGVTDLSGKAFRSKLAKFFNDLRLTRSKASDGHVAVSTRQRMLGQVRALVNFAIDTDVLSSDPLRKFKVAGDREQADTNREVLSVAEARRLVALDRVTDPVWIHCMLMLYAGMRDAEAERVKWQDYDEVSRLLHVRQGKGGKSRSIAVQPELGHILARVNKAIGPEAKHPCMPSTPIAKPTPGKNLRRYELFVKQLADAGVKYERGADEITKMPRRLIKHSMRHTYCAALLATGEPGEALRISMGHGGKSDLTILYGAQRASFVAVVSDEGWPLGRLCFAGPYGPSHEKGVAGGEVAAK
jgi:integrase